MVGVETTKKWFSRYCPATEGATNTLTSCDKWCEQTIVVSQGWLAKWSNNCVESLGPHVGIASAGWRCRWKSKRAMARCSRKFTHCHLIGVLCCLGCRPLPLKVHWRANKVPSLHINNYGACGAQLLVLLTRWMRGHTRGFSGLHNTYACH